ncbi:MAG: glycine betaine ABC transporter substrate-binding protein [Geitlerinemataceae cyanobacterium]
MFFSQYVPEILLRTGEHLVLVAIAMVVSISIGLPLGILITRQPKLAQTILGVANAVQTIPSLAIFGFLISVPFLGGIGKVPAIVALTLYALLPLIRNTYIGINSVDPAIREAGKGMGMTDRQLLFQVEIPLALGVILAGVRVATVISVGIATIAAAIGGGGLGIFIFRGLSTVNNQLILIGAIPATLMALVADFALGYLEKRLTSKREQKIKSYPKKLWVFFASILALGGLILFVYQPKSSRIIIGSKNYTEQVFLSELLAQQIESKTDIKVDRRFNLGGTFICHEAVKAGKIDGYFEYTGTALTAILQEEPISDRQKVYEIVKERYDRDFKLDVLSPLGFDNVYGMMIRGEDSKLFQVKTLSEVAKYTPKWTAGFGYEFLERKDGYPGLAETYGLKFSNIQQMDGGLMYKSLAEKKIDFIAGSSTEGLIPVLDLFVLEDDKQYFPPYEAVPVFNQATLKKYPELREAIYPLAGLISSEEMQKMNYQIDNQSRSVEDVVRQWRKAQNFESNHQGS